MILITKTSECMYVSMYLCIYVCIYVSMYVSMYLCIYLCIYVSIYLCNKTKECMDQPGNVANPALGQLNKENEYFIFPCPRARLRIWSRVKASAVPSRVSLLISILRLNLVLILTGFIPISAAASIYLFVYLVSSFLYTVYNTK